MADAPFADRMKVLTIYAHGADDATRRGYLERAYALGRDFAL